MDRIKQILSSLSHLNLEGQITDKKAHASGFGGSCDVYSAWSAKHNKKVAVKQIRAFMRKDEAFAKRLVKEIRIWTALDHDNVLPLLGYLAEGEDMTPSFISEWMDHGTMYDYMKTFPRNCIETCQMLLGIASGLAYLHSKEVIHADLKSQNILISASKSPLLADFGLSLMLSQTQATTGTTSSTRGTVRWMAKELFQSSSSGSPKYNETTDIWAFGMIAYELLSWSVPYSDKRADHIVMLAIMRGELPDKPEETGDTGIFEGIWGLCRRCWSDDSFKFRPTAVESMAILTDIIRSSSVDNEQSAREPPPPALEDSRFIFPALPPGLAKPNIKFTLAQPRRHGNTNAQEKSAAPYIPRPPNAFILFRAHIVRAHHTIPSSAASASTPLLTDASGNDGVPSPLCRSSYVGVTPGNGCTTCTSSTPRSLGVLASKAWHALPTSEREVWHRKALAAKAEHMKKYPGWYSAPDRIARGSEVAAGSDGAVARGRVDSVRTPMSREATRGLVHSVQNPSTRVKVP